MSAAPPTAAAGEATVTLISGAEERVTIPARVAAVSGMLRAALQSRGGFAEGRSGGGGGGAAAGPSISLPEISGAVLERCVAYMHYKMAHAGGAASAPLPPFDIPPEMALQLLVAANYMDM